MHNRLPSNEANSYSSAWFDLFMGAIPEGQTEHEVEFLALSTDFLNNPLGEAMMPARSVQRRIADVLEKLETGVDVNAWVASASATGDAWLVPLSFYWNGAHLVLATPANSRTARNLRRAGVARPALGPTNDVVIIEGDVTTISRDDIEPALANAHAKRARFDARTERDEYIYLLVRPRTIQAWSGPAEWPDRVIMREGQWLAPRSHDA